MKWRGIARCFFWLCALAPLLITFLFFPALPRQAAVHFGQMGIADRWGSKLELLIPGVVCLLVAVVLELSLARSKDGSVGVHMLGGLLFLALAFTQAIICAANADTVDGAREAPALAFYELLPAVCWVGLGLFMLFARTLRYFNLYVPWILLDPAKDRRASRFGGVTMLFMGCLGLAAVVFSRGSTAGFVGSCLLGAIGFLALYVYCRALRS